MNPIESVTVRWLALMSVVAVLTASAAMFASDQPPAPDRKPDPLPAAAPPLPRVPPLFNPGEPASVHRVRSIKAAFRGQKVEIQDRGGRDIRMKVTKTVAGQLISESLEAADVEALRTSRPEFGSLYDRLAGPR